MEKKWYVLQVMTGTELTCRRRIRESGIRAEVPTKIMPEIRSGKWHDHEIVMLPGYVFIQLADMSEGYYQLSGIPNVVRILPGFGRYDPVPEDQMRWVLTLANGGEPWGVSEARKEGGAIYVLCGPLANRESEILRWDRRRRRAKIRVRVLDETRIIDVGLKEA